MVQNIPLSHTVYVLLYTANYISELPKIVTALSTSTCMRLTLSNTHGFDHFHRIFRKILCAVFLSPQMMARTHWIEWIQIEWR